MLKNPFCLFVKGTPSSSSTWIWALYSIIIAIFFIFIKLINHRLHIMFDGEEIPQKTAEGEQSEEQTGDADATEHTFPSTSQADVETIELQVLPGTSQVEAEVTSITENGVVDLEIESTEAVQGSDSGKRADPDVDLVASGSMFGIVVCVTH